MTLSSDDQHSTLTRIRDNLLERAYLSDTGAGKEMVRKSYDLGEMAELIKIEGETEEVLSGKSLSEAVSCQCSDHS